MRSMTGFGRGVGEGAIGTVTAEIKAVNSRFLEINIRSDHFSGALEEAARQAVKNSISRGKLNIFLSFKPSSAGNATKVTVNEGLVNAYLDALTKVQAMRHVKKGKVSVADLLALPEPFLQVTKEDLSDEDMLPLVTAAMEMAISSLIAMREKEGENLKNDLLQRLTFLRQNLTFLISKQDVAAQEYEERLRQRMEKLISTMGVEIDEGRLLEEVAIYSEKTDYTEEVVRFASHLEQFEEMLAGSEPVGRKLDFLLQEINREANTTASKASDREVIDTVITIKTELEKIREQIQNIE